MALVGDPGGVKPLAQSPKPPFSKLPRLKLPCCMTRPTAPDPAGEEGGEGAAEGTAEGAGEGAAEGAGEGAGVRVVK